MKFMFYAYGGFAAATSLLAMLMPQEGQALSLLQYAEQAANQVVLNPEYSDYFLAETGVEASKKSKKSKCKKPSKSIKAK